jgi:hypothetical protein
MKLFSPATITLLFLILTSCKKTSEGSPDPNRLLISRIVETAEASSPDENLDVTDFVYDDQQRVDKIVFSYGERVNGKLITTEIDNIKYYYTGTDKKPYKANGQIQPTLKGDIFYTYNASGALVRDSAISSSTFTIITRHYTHFTDKIMIKRDEYREGFMGQTTEHHSYTDSFLLKNNNISEAVFGSYAPNADSYYYQSTYNDKINPISKLNIAAIKITEGIRGTFSEVMAPGSCKNNITRYDRATIPPQGAFIKYLLQKHSFTYTREGLPETCTVENQLRTYTIQYSYKGF